MLAWVCWDEFVHLESPYTVRWVEKCNERHIAALRILTRNTISQAVASREYNFQPGSLEVGNLMSALLMAAMSKLAAMRTTAPVVLDKAEDTVTKLMRGLFGNLLTIAGSGVRPLSMVWQLFGQNPQYDLPSTEAEWIWYQTVVALYPYTGWPLKQFYENLEKLLDKAIVRVVTKGEDLNAAKSSRADEIIKYCKLRNIQLEHSRTIITIFMRMLTTEDIGSTVVAGRLLDQLPRKLELQTQSYARMIQYLEHLAEGGQRRAKDDLIAASVYTKRSAAFGELKAKVLEACVSNDWSKMKEHCQALIDAHAETASLWHVNPKLLNVQNIKLYKELLDADFGDNVNQATKTKNLELTRQVLGDAEIKRSPWQVGKEGQFSDRIEPLNEAFLQHILTGEKSEPSAAIEASEQSVTRAIVIEERTIADDFLQFKSSLQPSFITTMQKNLSAEDACKILKIPVTAMRVFIKPLNPEFVWGDLGENFKTVILGLLRERSNRLESHPIRKLLGVGREETRLRIEGN